MVLKKNRPGEMKTLLCDAKRALLIPGTVTGFDLDHQTVSRIQKIIGRYQT